MSIINTTKDLIDLAKKGAAVELEIRLVRMQEAELELREEIVKLKTELASIKEAAKTNETLEYNNGTYIKDGVRYCQLCWDSKNILVRLQEHENQDIDEYDRVYTKGVYYECLNCDSRYGL